MDIMTSDHLTLRCGGRPCIGAQHRTLANKGNEAMAYLQFILDYWHRLPASIVFLHGHRCAPSPELIKSSE